MKSLTKSAISTTLFYFSMSLVSAQEIIKTHLSDAINTAYTENKPMISANGKTLFFARQNAPDNFDGEYDEQDIYFSYYGAKGWEKSKNIGAPLNNEKPNGVVSISPSGETLFLLDSYEDAEAQGVSVAHRTDSSWTNPEMIPIQDFHNHSEFIDYFFSSNGQEILIAVERDDSRGDQDLYVSKKTKSGDWSKPINLGDQINSVHPEFSPFLAIDNKTLFFSSMGHENYGNADIFYSKRLDSTWTNWSEPENLGPEVNSEHFEAYYTIPANGTIGYYVSAQGGLGKSRDIFSITIPYQFRPEPVILLQGKFLTENEEVDSAFYDVNFLTISSNESQVQIDYEVNHFNAILPTGGSYFFYVNKSEHISESHYIDLTDQKEYMEESADIHTIPVKKGEDFTSHNIQFEEYTADFVPSTYFELVRLLEVFKKYPCIKIELVGHAHDYKDSLRNLSLSIERLQKVRDFYLSEGFEEERLSTRAVGDQELNSDHYKKHVNSQFNVNNRIEFFILDTEWESMQKVSSNGLRQKDAISSKLKIISENISFQILFGFDEYRIAKNS
jgi:outer membrane protein OmpA-like peptidoglycan-associated protein